MEPISLEIARIQLDAWLAASLALATSGSYSIGGRSLTRANAYEVNMMIEKWAAEVKRLESSTGSSGLKFRGVTPL